MKKKLILLVTMLIGVFMINNTSANAYTKSDYNQNDYVKVSEKCEYSDTKTYVLYETYYYNRPSRALPSNSNIRNASYSEYLTKDYMVKVTEYTSDDKEIWSYALYGTFEIYYGISARCTNSSCEIKSNDAHWRFSNVDATSKNNVAYGDGTVKYMMFYFIPASSRIIDISIKCDEYGNKIK